MFKEFFIRKMVASKMKGVPKEQQEQFIKAIEANPELFETIAKEIQAKTATGKDQMSAMMEVMQSHKEELSKALSQ
ncbi:hypothetical protein COU17_00390 [Candidatus Kaiserbacteria bacterium CG10_big_fil_rev_8_21_14_0_10_49_17]|uniref:Uncharacterized protein n=1 Tax=Candidatus Kaiserbacteria bacterium CG10_big_fil_rev_8_21_14_0_10_49_17 TaxID=1974609 RepID=A0A2M6WF83_9BACT|nr:MAG: hypothetical protein COU17_00390 [Candidatus Kaiserbacteria bacterium CG10_big_fil_rev_8_21_14_0_10_49_17]